MILEMPAGTEQCPCQIPHGRHVQMSLIHHCSHGDRSSHLLMRLSKLKDHTIRIICSSPPMGINHQKEKKKIPEKLTLNSPKILKFETHFSKEGKPCCLFPYLQPIKQRKHRSLPDLLQRAIYYDKASCHCPHEVISA